MLQIHVMPDLFFNKMVGVFNVETTPNLSQLTESNVEPTVVLIIAQRIVFLHVQVTVMFAQQASKCLMMVKDVKDYFHVKSDHIEIQ